MGFTPRKKKRSWKTTLGGICLALGAPLASAGDGIYQTIGIALASLGGLLVGTMARDNNKSSKDVHAGS